MNELTLDLVQSQLKPKQRLLISEETVKEIELLSKDPDYGEEFLDLYLDHLNVLKETPRASHDQYLNAIKFFGLVEAGNSLTDAYIKTFPQRYKDRRRNHPDAGDGSKDFMRSEASRFNSSKLVNEIRKVACIPIQLIHRGLLHEAILNQAQLMRTARSEMVRQKAGAVIISELKPQEDTVIAVKVEDGSKSVIEELRLATERLAIAEQQSVKAGMPLSVIASANVYEGEIVEEESDGD